MPPQLAALICYCFIAWLFIRDIRQRPNVSAALWLPILWFLLLATRHPSHWLALWGIHGFQASSAEEGSTFDALFYLGLIIAGMTVLVKRQIRLSTFAHENGWLIAFLAYCLIATFWSDLPFPAFKRWIKVFGHPVMALVIITDRDQIQALKRFITRSAYIILPISILWIKYFPHLGRKAGGWATSQANIGITTGKNMLGNDCMILAIFLFWFVLQIWPQEKSQERTRELRLMIGLLLMAVWCLDAASSATSLLAFLLASSLMILVRYPAIGKRVGTYAVCGAILIFTAQVTFDIASVISELRGKGNTVAGRGRLWEVLLGMDTNPLIGVGFETFWHGARMAYITSLPEFSFWRPNEAHNGYLEIYLTLGLIGLLLLMGMIVQAYKKCRRELTDDFEIGRFRIGALMALIAYNWMEAGFRGLSVVFFTLFVLALMPRRQLLVAAECETEWDMASDGAYLQPVDHPRTPGRQAARESHHLPPSRF